MRTLSRAYSKSSMSTDVFVLPRGPEGGFVDEVADVGAGQADRAAAQSFEVDVVGERHVARVDLEDCRRGL